MAIRTIKPIEIAFIKHQLESRDAFLTKRCLQYICELYRKDFRISAADLFGIENSVVGLIQTSPDDKVIRWALNALGRIGRKEVSLNATLAVLGQHAGDPAISAAAIAALFKLQGTSAYKLLKEKDQFPHDLIVLSALQNTSLGSLDIAATRVNIENAHPDILKLALVTVGLDRAPENIFHPRFENSKIVQVLGGHHDNVVAQYSVWATLENPHLSASDLGIDPKRIDDRAENVRAWIYQLFGSKGGDPLVRHEMVLRGSVDESSMARIGLATGLRDTYYTDLDKIVAQWHLNEDHPEVSALTVDHMVRQSQHSESYRNIVLERFRNAYEGSLARERMLAMAAQSAFYSELRKAEVQTQDLLTLTKEATIGTLNIGTLQANAVAIGGGTAVSHGPTQNYLSAEQISSAIQVLSDARSFLADLSQIPGQGKVLEEIDEAIADPQPTKLERAGKSLDALCNAIVKAADTAEAAQKLGQYGAQILDFISRLSGP